MDAKINDGGPAFPTMRSEVGGVDGMTLRDWFATFAPPPRRWRVKLEQDRDRSRNPHNDSHKPKLRSEDEIVADLRYEHADAMLRARAKSE
mgnify:CR=1 FL=1